MCSSWRRRRTGNSKKVLAMVKAAEMLEFVETPGERVLLTARGRSFVATPDTRPALWRERLVRLGLFREVHDRLRRQPGQPLDREFVLETILTRMPHENLDRVFNTFVRWARFGGLFTYAEANQRLLLIAHSGDVTSSSRFSAFV